MVIILNFNKNYISVYSDEFKNGVNNLAKILKITPHPDHLITLKAIRKVVCKRLSPEALEKPQNIIVKVSKKFNYNIQEMFSTPCLVVI